MAKSLNEFFNPKSVAVIGASHNPQKIGHIVLKNFVEEGFAGKVFPVNPKAESILGLQAFKSVKDIPEQVDLAVILTPAQVVNKVLKECGEKKVKAVSIISSGFKEIGTLGLRRENELKKTIEKYKLTVLGPNCLGVFDSNSQVDMLFLPAYRLGRPKKGSIAFITQSGAFGSVILDWAAQEGFGISKFISYGNAIDVDAVDLLEYLGNDAETKVITIYLEGANRPRELIEAGKRISKIKPVICFKAGKSERGTKAIQSHTGSLAGADEIYTGAFKQAGIMRVYSSEEMFDIARALAMQPLMKGNKIAIITDGGGFGIVATDSAEDYGLAIPEISAKGKKRLEKRVPAFASLHNPIDLTGSATDEMYKYAIEVCMAEKNIDGILVILLFQPPNIESDVIQHILEIKEKYSKPMVVCSAGGNYTQLHRDILDRSGIPTYSAPHRAIMALSALYTCSKTIEKRAEKLFK